MREPHGRGTLHQNQKVIASDFLKMDFEWRSNYCHDTEQAMAQLSQGTHDNAFRVQI